ncbi:hypothetical protein [Mycobacteroides abscessus]|uniref:hypothetical protein n=1 Tax=Mycobacteroides abscessus TaxID=36809 RepID=UPI0009264C5C|nr:hypothetical protein [Mycobacteroides abscessus]SIL07598.1 Uncharacterised protein [Mycobacteroides abscessus subsp. abscessus]SKR79872.1 Uncharacterised protein [Mycobacteroides abscessus subsp. abscessus]SKR84489.1 Uncharacterised protein [Mycobacteroides abscessus subsp. abscessus]SKT25232.1 Uncharacterised protein [Mycobacteroides abscessus subsp. abscessus]
MTVAIEYTAVELVENRRGSRIGTEQQHYLLHPELDSPIGPFSSVIVVPGETSTYLFAANEDGDIGDFRALTVVTDTRDPRTALSQLAYRIVSADAASSSVVPERWGWEEQSQIEPGQAEKVTVVYPQCEGGPITYPNCEIDEVDNRGYLRITGTSAAGGREAFEYMVWAPGTFTHAETFRGLT